MASICKYTQKDGTESWYVKYYTHEKGKNVSRTKRGFKSQRDAKLWAKRVEVQINDNSYIPATMDTLSEYIDEYMELYCIEPRLSPKTIAGYSAIVENIKKASFADKPMQKITTDDIQRYINGLYIPLKDTPDNKTVSANTASHYFTFINMVFNKARSLNKIPGNPCDLVEKPPKTKYKHTILTPEEVFSLLTTSKGGPLHISVLLAGCMGLRKSEVLGLRWQDVDFNQGTLQINSTRLKVNKKEILKIPKTEKSARLLYMPAFVVKELKEHKSNIIIDISHNLVCSHTTGEPLSIDTFSRRFERLLKKVGINKKVRFHDLRHTSAAILTLAGANPKEVSDYLGHAKIGTTMDLYADIFDTAKQKTAKKMNKMFKGL